MVSPLKPWLIFVFAIAPALGYADVANQSETGADAVNSGAWSAAAVSLFNTWSALDDNPNRHVSFFSPDRKKQIDVVGESVSLLINGKTYPTDINNESKHDAELAWAPDSTKYFVTWTDGGGLGQWHVQVYGVDESGIHEYLHVEESAREDFEKRVRKLPVDPRLNTPKLKAFWDTDVYCEPYNVIGGRWINGSEEILLSVLINNVGDCRYMGEFNVYRVDATTGKILQRYTAAKAHQLFGDKYLPKIVH